MRQPRLLQRITLIAVLVATVVSPAASFPAPPTAEAQGAGLADRAIFFASDGMRPDLVEHYAEQGHLPTMATLMQQGTRGENGMVKHLPTGATPPRGPRLAAAHPVGCCFKKD